MGSSDCDSLSTRELEALAGERLGPKVQMVLLEDDRVFLRAADGRWYDPDFWTHEAAPQ